MARAAIAIMGEGGKGNKALAAPSKNITTPFAFLNFCKPE